MALLSAALATARTLLNDDVNAVWSDTALIPKAQEAHRELQTMLWDVGSPVVRAESSPIAVTALATAITAPADLLVPLQLFEFATVGETRANAIPMTEYGVLPMVAQTTLLRYWTWKAETITLLGATTARSVIIYYRRLITVPAAAGDAIGITFGELYIGARAAALAHGSVGNKDAFETCSAQATANFQRVLIANRGQQSPASRP